jgi:hypothetical protein
VVLLVVDDVLHMVVVVVDYVLLRVVVVVDEVSSTCCSCTR